MSPQPTSPSATGNRGGTFEQQVGACYLAYLLTRGTPPFLQGSAIDEVHLQTEHLGWQTDDLLLVGTVGSNKRKVALQVKSAFTFSGENKECQEVFKDAWKDFNNSTIFDRGSDGIALVCGPLPLATQRRWRIVFDAAQASLDATDWLHRLALPGYHEQGAAAALDTLRSLLSHANGCPINDVQLWQFAKAFDFQWLDLLTPNSSTEAAVRSLLAFTATVADLSPPDTAKRTWSDLIALVATASPNAASYDYAKLPQELRQRHEKGPSVTASTRRAIDEHSNIVECGVRTKIAGKLALARSELVATVQVAWEQHRIVCVCGPAGSGKSGLAKVVFDLMKPQGLAVAFRAESFAEPHLNDVFTPHGFTAEQLHDLAALHSRKWIWVESVERLLEKPERHAFLDLLQLAAADQSIRLILTCRDYQVESVRSAMFGTVGLEFVHIAVPSLRDDELAEAARQVPALAVPLATPRLRELLRNLFMMEKAASLNWSVGTAFPQNEREFRCKVWKEVIRRDDRPTGGMPLKRSVAFIGIAMRRAQKLEPFVACDDLDPEALRQLKDDGLTISPANDDTWVATAHDVLEDWALLEWLTQQWRRHENDVPKFLAQIGTFPALRRAYRRWLTEWMEAEPTSADQFVVAVLVSVIEEHWRDDTLAATLLSSTATDFIARTEVTLVADKMAFLRRCIHLLRVACKGTPPWWKDRAADGIAPLVPEGPAWGAIVDLVHKHLTDFSSADRPLLVGLLVDWSLSVSSSQPYPAGSDSAAHLAYALLPANEDYTFRADELSQALTEVMVKVPKPVEKELHDRVRLSTKGNRWDRWRPGFAGLVLSHSKGGAVARDYPDLTIETVEAYLGLWLTTKPKSRSHHRQEVAEAFGLPARLEFDDHQASAFRGPFLNLLTYHQTKGLDLILRVMNTSTDAYGDPKVRVNFIEKPSRVTLHLSDGTKVEQWANSRLWMMYRGTSVAPYILSSALMALELWLFDLAESKPNELDNALIDLLRRSNNVAITAVVSSVAQAHPHRAGGAGIALLSCPLLFHLDRGRYVSDSTNHDKIFTEAFPPQDAEHAIFSRERIESHVREHRREQLETFAVRLQFGPQRAAVQKILDNYRLELPPIDKQDDEIKLWRLLLHRIDLRNFEATQKLADGRALIQARAPASDVQAVVDKHLPSIERTNQRMGLWVWSMHCWEKKADSSSDPKQWRDRLREVRQMDTSEPGAIRIEERLDDSAIPQVAALCIRDHWEELMQDERNWCCDRVCESAKEGADDHNVIANMMHGTLDNNRAAAEVLPILIGKTLSDERRKLVTESLAIALTHAQDQMRLATAYSIGRHLWAINPTLTRSCIGALAGEALFMKVHRKEQNEVAFNERVPWEQIEQAAAIAFRPSILSAEPVDREKLLSLTLSDGSGHKVLPLLLGILVLAPSTDQLAIEFFALVSRTLAHAWSLESEKGNRSTHSKFDDDEEGLDFEKEVLLSSHLSQFLLDLLAEDALRVATPTLDAAILNPEKGGRFLERLILAQDRRKPTPTFWALWQAIVDRFFAGLAQTPSVAQRNGASELVSKMFLGVDWKPDERDWLPLNGEATRLERTFLSFTPHPAIIEYYLVFLRRAGSSRLLPSALVSLASRLAAKPASSLLTPRAVACLEEILGRYIYSDPRKLKSSPELRAAVLSLLNTCIQIGSSACYRQRDDFLTPTASRSPTSFQVAST